MKSVENSCMSRHWPALSINLKTDWEIHDLWPIVFNFVFEQSLAEDMKSKAQSLGLMSEVVDLKNYEPEDSLSEEVKRDIFSEFVVCSIVSKCEKYWQTTLLYDKALTCNKPLTQWLSNTSDQYMGQCTHDYYQHLSWHTW